MVVLDQGRREDRGKTAIRGRASGRVFGQDDQLWISDQGE